MTKSARLSVWKRGIIPELEERCISDNDAWTLADSFQTFLSCCTSWWHSVVCDTEDANMPDFGDSQFSDDTRWSP